MRWLCVLSAYVLGAGFVTVVWTDQAGTERSENRYNSIVALADGSARIPFVRRRLVFDTARVLVNIVPDVAWRTVEDDPRVWQAINARRLDWQRKDFRILFTTTSLIGASVFGFMLVTRAMFVRLYRSPRWLADLAGFVLGMLLLGGGGDGHYQWYPYDFPNAFVFALTLLGFLGGRWWAYLVFAAACYSKETAFALIFARWLLLEDRWRWRPYVGLAVMTAYFAVVQYGLRTVYTHPDGEGFWMLGRNAMELAKFALFDSWLLLLLVLSAARLGSIWGRFPWQFRRLFAVPLLFLAATVFKGWLEERRAYLENLAIFGPMAIQWLLIELGFDELIVPREAEPTAAEVASRT